MSSGHVRYVLDFSPMLHQLHLLELAVAIIALGGPMPRPALPPAGDAR